MIPRNSLLAAACLVTMTGLISIMPIESEAAGVTPPQVAAKQATETPDMLRASKLIGETVRNGNGDEIGSVDDLILNRGDRVLYAVISVGGFLGVGEKLVAVPIEALTLGSKEIDGVVIYDTTREQLDAAPAFSYADANAGMSRERFMQSAERRVDFWQDRVAKGVDSAKSNAKELKEGASQRVDGAWKKAQAAWDKLKGASADAWEGAKQTFDDAMTDLEQAWNDASS